MYEHGCGGATNERGVYPLFQSRWRGGFLSAAIAVGLAIAPAGASAISLRVALSTDAATMDPHGINSGSTTLVLRQIYEPLVGSGKHLEPVPALAVAWSNPEPTSWRFKLRPDVRFQDGSTFDADDVVFSLARSREGFSDFKLFTSTVTEVHKIDPLTVDIITAGPDPTLPSKLTHVFIMDREWSIRHDAQRVLDSSAQGSYAATHTNGTGPYRLVSRDPGGRIAMERYGGWWGRNESGVDSVDFIPMTADSSRVAALLAGDVDVALDIPPELVDRVRRATTPAGTPKFRVLEATDNRTIFLGMDLARDQLLYSDVKGRNPFKDRRVREALYRAIDPVAIQKGLLQGHSAPTALMWAPSVFGYSAADDVRPPANPARARELLAEAGFGAGFGVTLDCPTDRYVDDEQICQAIAAQLARIGVRVTVNALPFAVYVAKLRRFDTSFYLLGWATPTQDAYLTAQAIMRTPGDGADGVFNFGRYSNPAVDALIDRLKFEPDPAMRRQLIREIGRLHKADFGHIPLHDQTIIWAMRADIDAVLPPENQLDVKWVTVRN